MKVTKRQLRRIIREEKRKILREQSWAMSTDSDPLDDPGTQMISRPGKAKQNYFPDTDARLEGPEFSQSAIDEMQDVIEMFLDDNEPAMAKALEGVFSTALHDMSAMGEPSQKLINMYQKLDDMARGEIPYEIGGWIRGETW